jgi:hypothetical protein
MLLINKRKQQHQGAQTQNVKTTIVNKEQKVVNMKGNRINQRQSHKTREKKKTRTCCSMDDKNHNNKTMKKTKDIENPNLM